MRKETVFIISTLLVGCATTDVTDPSKDSLGTSLKCTFTNSCENHNLEKEKELEQAKQNNAELTNEQIAAKADLAESERALAVLRADVSNLDKEIARMQNEAASASAETADIDPQTKELLAELDELRAESRDLEFDVLKETIDVAAVEAKKIKLEQWRDQLEQVLSASM